MADVDRDPDSDETGADDEAAPPHRPWSTTAQLVAAILWPSFLAACMATMLVFAFVDPELVQQETTSIEISRMTGYGIGFFFFWFVAAASSAVSVFLLRTAHAHGDLEPRNPERQ